MSWRQHPNVSEIPPQQPELFRSGGGAEEQEFHQQQYDDNNNTITMSVPALSDLLGAVFSVGADNNNNNVTSGNQKRSSNSNNVVYPSQQQALFNLLSGIVAAVEVTNDKVNDLNQQYQELSFEVATISRVISSNQLGAENKVAASVAAGGPGFIDVSVSASAAASGGGGGGSASTSSTPAKRRQQHQQVAKIIDSIPTKKSNSSNSQHQQPKQGVDLLAAESVNALHTHAVGDLEDRLDALAVRVDRLQEEVGLRAREAMEKAYADVVQICDTEKGNAEKSMQQLTRTFEGQAAVRLAEMFREGETTLQKVTQEAYKSVLDCGHELATSFAQTGRAFMENTSRAVENNIARSMKFCTEIVCDARESAAMSAHNAIAQNYETESKMIWMLQAMHRLSKSGNNSSTSSASAVSNGGGGGGGGPLVLRCCSALEEIRALYSVLGVDGSEALRIFKSHFARTPLLDSSSSSSSSRSSRKSNNSTSSSSYSSPSSVEQEQQRRQQAQQQQQQEKEDEEETVENLAKGGLESLGLLLRTPMMRCLDPLPGIGLRVTDAPKPTPGAEVVHLEPGQRAQMAGLKIGDIILRVDGRDLGVGAASRGILHLALLTAPNRPLPIAVRSFFASEQNQQQLRREQEQEHERSVAAAAATSSTGTGVRWGPQMPKQDLQIVRGDFGNRKSHRTLHATSTSSGRNGGNGGVTFTVYRFKDALTFSCSINLDPLS